MPGPNKNFGNANVEDGTFSNSVTWPDGSTTTTSPGGGVSTTIIDDTDSPHTTSNEDIIYVDESAGAVTVTLASSDATQGNEIEVVSLSGTNTITINTEGSETIDPGGASSKSLDAEGWPVAFVSDGTNWAASVVSEFETVHNQNYVETQVTASEGTSYNANLLNGNYHKVTLTGDVTFDITNADASDVNSLVLHLVQDGTGSRTPSFTPTIVWDGGSAPSWSTSANAEDVITLVHDQDGSQWLGFVGGLGMA